MYEIFKLTICIVSAGYFLYILIRFTELTFEIIDKLFNKKSKKKMKKRINKFWYFVEMDGIEIPVEIELEVSYEISTRPVSLMILNWQSGRGYSQYNERLNDWFAEHNNRAEVTNYFFNTEL